MPSKRIQKLQQPNIEVTLILNPDKQCYWYLQSFSCRDIWRSKEKGAYNQIQCLIEQLEEIKKDIS